MNNVLVYDMYGNDCMDTEMNELIAKLYDQAIVLEGNGDYVAGELNPVKFAELIVRECARIARNTDLQDVEGGDSAVLRAAGEQIQKHFGVEQ